MVNLKPTKTNIMERFGAIELLLLLLIAVPFYVLPTIIALHRRNTDKKAIIVLNLLSGWTMVGWIITFIWACSPKKNRLIPLVATNNHYTERDEKIEFPAQSLHNKLDSLRRLQDLLDSEALTPEQYEAEKAKVLRR